MRASQTLMPSQKETPQEAQLISHQLMLRAGMIHAHAAGIYSWLPLGLQVIHKIEAIVRTQMCAIGASECLMPSIQPAELWKTTGRWDKYGKELLRLKDRHDRDFCYGPTHEEIITELMRHYLNSHKQLPLCLFQIQTKFRDEIRPRFGVLRAREFIMKDAYSFHTNAQDCQKTYDSLYTAYEKILQALSLEYKVVEADSGSIGGHHSHEFHVLAQAGEDTLVYSDQGPYAANLEQASSLPPSPAKDLQALPIKTVETPGITDSIKQWAQLGLSPDQCIKTLIVKGTDHPQVALIIRGDHTLNPIKAQKHPLVASPLTFIDPNSLDQPEGFIGPKALPYPILADPYALACSNFCCGANQINQHLINVNWEQDLPSPEPYDLREVSPGDPSPDGKGYLQFTKGIEVGHIFQLGTQYSEALDARFSQENGQQAPAFMGCYGLGISRLVAAIIEQHHDEQGILWPESVAPFKIHLLPLHWHKVRSEAEALFKQLHDAGHSVLFEDREASPGSLFAHADLIGLPHRLVISPRTLSQNQVEYQRRGQNEKQLIPLDQILAHFQAS